MMIVNYGFCSMFSMTYKVDLVYISSIFDIKWLVSGNVYNIDVATLNDVVYPSFDPSIFEVKYPDKDIVGKVSSY